MTAVKLRERDNCQSWQVTAVKAGHVTAIKANTVDRIMMRFYGRCHFLFHLGVIIVITNLYFTLNNHDSPDSVRQKMVVINTSEWDEQ